MKKYFKRLFRKHHEPIYWKSFFKTHILFFGIGCLISFAIHHFALEFYSFKEIAIEDIDFSDLYYQIREPSAKEKNSNDIIIINSGSIVKDSVFGRRKDMIRLLRIIDTKDSLSKTPITPRKVGIDLYYTDRLDKRTDDTLEKILQQKKYVIALTKQDPCIFKKVKTGYANFPSEENKTVRNYYNYYTLKRKTINSFAHECLDTHNHNSKEQVFYLKYYCKDKGFYNVLDEENEDETLFAVPAIEAGDILNNAFSKEKLSELFNKKIVLIGNLGEGFMDNNNDITDKHKTPTEFEFISKSQVMPGVVIHANAIKQLQMGEKVKSLDSGFYLFLILYFISLYFFIFFILIDQFESIFVQMGIELLFIIFSVILINCFCIKLLKFSLHLSSLNIAIMLLFLIELKSFLMKYYEDQVKLQKKLITKK